MHIKECFREARLEVLVLRQGSFTYYNVKYHVPNLAIFETTLNYAITQNAYLGERRKFCYANLSYEMYLQKRSLPA